MCLEFALRFAERGFNALAIDYFGRTAGLARRDDDFEYSQHVAKDRRYEESAAASEDAWRRVLEFLERPAA